MIKTKEDESRLPAFVVFNQLDDQKKQYKDQYSDDAVALAKELRDLASAAYTRSNTYLNYRAKFIAVKVDKPQQSDKIQNYKQIDALDEFVETHSNVKTKHVRNNLIFEIYNI